MRANDKTTVERSLVAIAAIAATIGVLTTTLTSAPSPVDATPPSLAPPAEASAGSNQSTASGTMPATTSANAETEAEISDTAETTEPEPSTPNQTDADDTTLDATAALDGEPAGEPTTIANADTIDALNAAVDLSGDDAHVLRLYEAFYGRQPDLEGARFWIDQRRNGASIEEIASAFAESDEFAATYGGLSDAAFVESAYRTALGRDIDTDGFAFWVVELDRGASRESLLVFFTSSDEFAAGHTASS